MKPPQSILLGATLDLPRCPHCSIDRPNLAKGWETNRGRNTGADVRPWAVYFCTRCGGGVLACGFSGVGERWVDKYYPEVKTIDPSIPDRPRSLLTQAVESKHAPAASLMACARSVDEMLMAKGYLKGRLYDKINNAGQNRDITPEMARWSHHVRLEATDERHPDILDPLATPEDAQQSIDFAIALAEYLFVLPGKIPAPIQAQSTGQQ